MAAVHRSWHIALFALFFFFLVENFCFGFCSLQWPCNVVACIATHCTPSHCRCLNWLHKKQSKLPCLWTGTALDNTVQCIPKQTGWMGPNSLKPPNLQPEVFIIRSVIYQVSDNLPLDNTNSFHAQETHRKGLISKLAGSQQRIKFQPGVAKIYLNSKSKISYKL